MAGISTVTTRHCSLIQEILNAVCKGIQELIPTIEGQAIGKIEGITSGTDTTSFTLNLKCTKAGNGKQEVKEYFNDEGELIKGYSPQMSALVPKPRVWKSKNRSQWQPARWSTSYSRWTEVAQRAV